MFRYDFRRRIMFYLALTVLIQVIWIGFIFNRDISEYTTYYKKEIVETNLSGQIKLLNNWVGIKGNIVKYYAKLLSESSFEVQNPEEFKNFVDSLAKLEPSFSSVYFTSEKGLNVISNGIAPKVDGRKREWYRGAEVRSLYISQPYIDAITNEYVITLSSAVNDKNGKFIGVLGADFLLSELFSRIHLAEDDLIIAVMITDDNEKVLYFESLDEQRNKNYQNVKLSSIYNEFNHKNEHIQIRADNMNANIHIYLKDNRHLIKLINYNYEFWIAIIAGVLGILIILVIISKKLAAPIRSLSESIKNLENKIGDTDISQENLDSDLNEIVHLFRSLHNHINDNIRQISQMNESMKEANLILENKNTEFRTALTDLSEINVELGTYENNYQILINNIEEMIWIVDLDAKVVYANDKFYKWLSSYQITAETIYLKDFIKNIQNTSNFDGISFFIKRDFTDFDLQIVDQANKAIDVVVNTTIIYFNESPVSVQFIARDVTSEKKLYNQYYQKNKQMVILNDISRSLTMKEDLRSILQLITDRIASLLNVLGVSIRMLNAEGYLEMAAFAGQELSKIYPYEPHIDKSHMGLALIEERIISIQSTEDLIFEDNYLESVLSSGVKLYYFPLFNIENHFGVLTVIAEKLLEQEDIRLLKSFSENASIAIEKTTLFASLRNNYLMTIESLSNALEEKVYNYKNHTKRVAEYSKLIAEKFYLSRKELDDIYISGLLHDIGKIGISDDILNHEDLLNEEEEALMRFHVEIGKKIVDPIGFNKQIVEGIYLHHKNYDMSGYPENIDLDRLPMFARIIGVADAFDSELIECKVRENWKLEIAFNQLELGKDSLYCPDVLAALCELIQDNREQVIQISQI